MDDEPAPCATFAFTTGGRKELSGSGAGYGRCGHEDSLAIPAPGSCRMGRVLHLHDQPASPVLLVPDRREKARRLPAYRRLYPRKRQRCIPPAQV